MTTTMTVPSHPDVEFTDMLPLEGDPLEPAARYLLTETRGTDCEAIITCYPKAYGGAGTFGVFGWDTKQNRFATGVQVFKPTLEEAVADARRIGRTA